MPDRQKCMGANIATISNGKWSNGKIPWECLYLLHGTKPRKEREKNLKKEEPNQFLSWPIVLADVLMLHLQQLVNKSWKIKEDTGGTLFNHVVSVDDA